jgi:ATP-dependent Lon protease
MNADIRSIPSLLSSQEHDEMIALLRNDHPWTREYEMWFPPGHLGVVEAFFRKVEGLVSVKDIQRYIKGMFIQTLGNLTIYVEVAGQDKVLKAALNALAEDACNASQTVCHACGTTVERGSAFCAAHKDRLVFASPRSDSSSNKTETHDVFHNLRQNEEETDGETEADAKSASQKAHTGPECQLYCEKDIARFERRAKGSTSSEKQRLQLLVQDLRDRGEYAPLAVVPLDVQQQLEHLEKDFPNFSEPIRLIQCCAALESIDGYTDRRLAVPPILLDGPPGIGKTEFGHALASIFKTGFGVVSMATAQSGAILAGSEKHWSNSDPGVIFCQLTTGKTANPIILLDELDKVRNEEGSAKPVAALYSLLEQRTAKAWHDLSVPELTLDASHIVWLATSNDYTRMDDAILSRFTVCKIAQPTLEQSAHIAGNIYRNLLRDATWGPYFQSELGEEIIAMLARRPPREARREIRSAIGNAAAEKRNYLILTDFNSFDAASAEKTIGFIWN